MYHMWSGYLDSILNQASQPSSTFPVLSLSISYHVENILSMCISVNFKQDDTY